MSLALPMPTKPTTMPTMPTTAVVEDKPTGLKTTKALVFEAFNEALQWLESHPGTMTPNADESWAEFDTHYDKRTGDVHTILTISAIIKPVFNEDGFGEEDTPISNTEEVAQWVGEWMGLFEAKNPNLTDYSTEELEFDPTTGQVVLQYKVRSLFKKPAIWETSA